jgi:hypothetical protein
MIPMAKRKLSVVVSYHFFHLPKLDLHLLRFFTVIAQEVQRAIPSAVEVLGDVSIRMANGETKQVKNLLVVNDHALLVETIGTSLAFSY